MVPSRRGVVFTTGTTSFPTKLTPFELLFPNAIIHRTPRLVPRTVQRVSSPTWQLPLWPNTSPYFPRIAAPRSAPCAR